jgi:hypothetical protein
VRADYLRLPSGLPSKTTFDGGSRRAVGGSDVQLSATLQQLLGSGDLGLPSKTTFGLVFSLQAVTAGVFTFFLIFLNFEKKVK